MSAEVKDGGPAFPRAMVAGCDMGCDGMTLRDYFAAKAMQAIISKIQPLTQFVQFGETIGPSDEQLSARFNAVSDGAYAYADAMLEARKPSENT